MGRMAAAAGTVLVGALVVGALNTPSVSSTLSSITGGVVGTPQCEVLQTDGTVAQMTPDEAAAATTAAVRGENPAVAISAPRGVTCSVPRPTGPAQTLTESGLTPRAAALRDEVRALFGPVPDGGFAPGGIGTGHGARSAHYEGRAVDFFFRPVGDPEQLARGWALTNWLVANALRLEVAVVIFDDSIWSTRRSAQGWRDYSNPTGATDPISRHLDHVHVDVVPGS
jgi:hypothetical protein